jgi:TolB-like protein/Flp pilus assembly protein TadD
MAGVKGKLCYDFRMSLFEELKRRNVIRVGIAYLVAAWLLLQIVDVLAPLLELPNWVGRLIFLILLVGLVPVLVFSWVYELTPEGLKREAEVLRDESISRHTAHKLNRLTIVLLVIVAGIVIVDRLIPETAEPIAPAEGHTEVAGTAKVADDRPSVAVVPFVNTSEDEANEYFADGISEELLSALSSIRNLRVPSRTSSFTFKNSSLTVAEIGSALQVENVLEGSVRKSGDRIRVAVQLIEVDSDTHIWSETFTRELVDIFAVQDEIAAAIVDALRVQLNTDEHQELGRVSTDSAQAYDEYLRGRFYWPQRNAGSLQRAVEHYEAALAIDPEFDRAWAALGDAYVVMPEYLPGTTDLYLPLARKALDKTLELNPDSPNALAAYGYLKAHYLHDWDGALADFERAVELAPDYATGRQFYGEVLNIQNRMDEALEQLRLARAADPLSVVIRHIPGYFLLWRGRYDEAEAYYNDALSLGIPFRWTYHNLDFLNTLRGDYDEARRNTRRFAELEGHDPAADIARIDAVENPALKDRALELLEQRTDITDGAFGKALQLMMLGEHELALRSLEAGLAANDPLAPYINFMKVYDPLRDDPRFQAMLEKMNLR